MLKRILIVISLAANVAPVAASAHAVPASKFLQTTKPYSPYEFLIGDWYTKLPKENAVVHQQFAWGAGKASISYATFIVMPGMGEHLHFGGMAIFNPMSKALDYLFAVEPGSGVVERGTISVQPDGDVVREVEALYPNGKIEKSRQTFHAEADGSVKMDLQSPGATGWRSSLQSGPMVMTRTPPQ